MVRNIFTDFKRHDLGPNFHERNYDGTIRSGVPDHGALGRGQHGPYGHDGRSMNLRTSSCATAARRRPRATRSRARLRPSRNVIDFLNTLVLFPPDDTASNLDPGDRALAGYPQFGHGRIKLVLFNDRRTGSNPGETVNDRGRRPYSETATLPSGTARCSVMRPEGQWTRTRSAFAIAQPEVELFRAG